MKTRLIYAAVMVFVLFTPDQLWAQDPNLGTADPVTVTMNADNKAVTANFTALSMAQSMTAHWLLDENTGSTATDIVAGRTATLINNPSWGLACANEGWLRMNCDASKTQAIVIPTSVLRPQAGAVALWVKPEDISGMQFILGHVLDGINRISLYSVSGNLALGLGSNAAQQVNIAPLVAGQLVHIALTWNETSYAVYVNAEQKAVDTFEGLTALNTTMDIGNYGDPANRTLGFTGIIEDIRTYNRALQAAEIGNLYYTKDVRQQQLAEFAVEGYCSDMATLPAGAKFESEVFSWRPWYNQTGDYQIRFTAAGQPDRIVTISVQAVQLQEWYRQFLVRAGKL